MWIGVPGFPFMVAADPVVTMLADHRVQGSIDLRVPADTVRALIADPRTIARIDNSGTTVTLKGRTEGGCQLVHSAVSHPIASVDYLSRVCPISDGWQSSLVESEGMAAFESVWRVQESGAQTKLTYELRAIPNLPIPQFVVNSQSRSAVQSLLEKLRDHLEGHE